MKKPPTPRTRFYCHLVRLRSASAAAGLAGRHAESCADCRQFFRASAGLESALRREAIRSAPPAPAGLEHRIVQAIRDSAPAPVSARLPSRWFAAAGSAAVALVAMALVFLHQPAPMKPAGSVTPSPEPQVAVSDESISERLFNALVPPAGKLVANNPLEHELDSVFSDARSALNFLALNFLPSTTSAGAAAPRAEQAGAKG